MAWFNPHEVNAAFRKVAPELAASKFATFPLEHERWLSFNETCEGKPVFIQVKNEGLKKDYVYCKRGPKGPGYYHLMTQPSYVNLVTRLSAEGPGGCLCFGDRSYMKAWDTTLRICYGRCFCSRPNDAAHMVEKKVNPFYAVSLWKSWHDESISVVSTVDDSLLNNF